MKTMCPSDYHYNGFVATHALCSNVSCLQTYELLQSHFRDNREGTLFS